MITGPAARSWGLALLLFMAAARAFSAGDVAGQRADLRVEVSWPASVRAGPTTGRLLLMFSREGEPEVRLQAGWVNSPPIFGVDVDAMKPGQPVVFEGG